MNRTNTFATTLAAVVLSFAAAGSAFADDITVDTQVHTSTATRAAVQAELTAFKARGVNPWSSSYNPRSEFKSTADRADVRAEILAARARGELGVTMGEDGGSSHLAQAAQPRGTAVASTRVAAR